MAILIYFILFLILVAFAVFLLLFFALILDSVFFGSRAQDLATSRRAADVVCKIIAKNKKDAKNFYDLGCGRGGLAIAIKKTLPELSVYGIEKNLVRVFFARMQGLFLRQKIIFVRKDIFAVDLRNADIVYTYLPWETMRPLEDKLRRELKNGAFVIANTTHFPNWKPCQIFVTFPKHPDFEKLFVCAK